MKLRDSLIEEFNFLGIKPADNILNKCEQACKTFDISAETFVELWTAYSVSKLNGAAPTLDSITAMIRKDLNKNEKKSVHPIKIDSPTVTNIKVYGDNISDLETEVLESYGNNVQTPKRGSKQDVDSPNGTPKRFTNGNTPLGVSPKQGFSPATYNPTAGQSSTAYAERKDSLQVAASYKGKDTSKNGSSSVDESTFTGKNDGNVSVKLFGDKDDWTPSNVQYMYTRIKATQRAADRLTDWLGPYLLERHSLGAASPFRLRLNEPFVTFGQIKRDKKGNLNPDSLVLASVDYLTGGQSISLDLTNLPEYTVFPGQVVAVKAVNHVGEKLVAEKLYTDAKAPSPTEIPVFGNGPIQVVTACGPFTLLYNLTYEPLQDLLKYAIKHKPDVLILIGPFVDFEHPLMSDPTMAETFDSFFETLIESIMQPLAATNVQVVMVSSQRDVHHHCVYPTPPFVPRNAGAYKNLHLVPDPCMLDINGVVVGVTATDVLFHFSKEQVSSANLTIDRIGRFCARIIEQQSFYPLYPPNSDVSMDKLLFEKYGTFPCTPHILILPSTFRFFVKNVSDCLVINPERLSKGNVGGTFARMQISPTTSNSLTECTAVDIVRI